MKGKLWLSAVMLTAGVTCLVAAGFAIAATGNAKHLNKYGKTGGTMNVNAGNDVSNSSSLLLGTGATGTINVDGVGSSFTQSAGNFLMTAFSLKSQSILIVGCARVGFG